MQQIENSLQKLGLTTNEITIYIYLLRKGVSLGSEIYSENEMDKSSTYEALSNLQNKGLVYSLGQSRNQKFGAIPADKLYEIYIEKEKELNQVRNDISSFIKDIDEYAKQNYKNKNISIIEGKDGFRKWAWARLDIPSGSTIREISSNFLFSKMIPENEFIDFTLNMTKERVKKGINMKAMMQKRDIENFKDVNSVETSNSKFLKEVRILPDEPEFIINSAMIIYGNKTSFLRKKNGQFLGVTIDDSMISSLTSNMFDFIWNQCKKI